MLSTWWLITAVLLIALESSPIPGRAAHRLVRWAAHRLPDQEAAERCAEEWASCLGERRSELLRLATALSLVFLGWRGTRTTLDTDPRDVTPRSPAQDVHGFQQIGELGFTEFPAHVALHPPAFRNQIMFTNRMTTNYVPAPEAGSSTPATEAE